MINNVTAVTNIGYAGLWDAYIKQMNRVGEEGPKITEDARIQKSLDEERKKVQRIYNSQGKIIKPYEEGRLGIILRQHKEGERLRKGKHLNILA